MCIKKMIEGKELMNLKIILDDLNTISNFDLAEGWDNVGLQIGNENNKINEIFITLEPSIKIINNIPNNSLLITHHPLIFKPINKIIFNDYPANIIEKLIKKDISLIAMHTNFDKTHLNIEFTKLIFPDDEIIQHNLICMVNVKCTFKELLDKVMGKFFIHKYSNDENDFYIENLALVCGSGMSLLDDARALGANAFITGDIRYHDALRAQSLGIPLIDVGHYESEEHFPSTLRSLIKHPSEILRLDPPFIFTNKD